MKYQYVLEKLESLLVLLQRVFITGKRSQPGSLHSFDQLRVLVYDGSIHRASVALPIS